MTDFSERIKLLRVERKLSQKELALQLGVTQHAVSFYETGKKTPLFDNLITLADYFDVSLDYLVGRSDIRERR